MFASQLVGPSLFKSLRTILSNTHRCSCAMAANNRVAVRRVEGEDRLTMTLSFTDEQGKDRVFTFHRSRDEETSSTLSRISANVAKFLTRKATKKLRKLEKTDPQAASEKLAELPTVDVQVFRDSVPVDITASNETVWVEGTELRIADHSYIVEVNVPNISSMKLPKCIVSGFPCYPRLEAEFIDQDACEFTWFLENWVEGPEPKKKKTLTWKEVHTGHTYTPTNFNIGKRLKLVCIPRNGTQTGEKFETESKVEVSAGPGLCPFENRQVFTAAVAPAGQFRVVSYNVLANTYADSDFSRTNLFPYCPHYALDFDYRKLLLLKEITGYNADIICVQECDLSFFKRDLKYVLQVHGMQGSFLKKYGQANEGEAIFYRSSKFKFIEQTEINITETLKTDPKHVDLWTKVQQDDALKTHMENRTNCLQTALLQSQENNEQRVLVATTHLFFHPKANLIRVIQTEIILKHLQQLLDTYQLQFEGRRPSVIFCGDLNSSPRGSVVEYINTGTVPADCKDYFNEENQRVVPDLNLSHSLNLTSGCGVPEYTNFTSTFKETLDYIFIDSAKLKTTQIVPLPSYEELAQFEAIPSVVFPSDHIALVCDVAFQENPQH